MTHAFNHSHKVLTFKVLTYRDSVVVAVVVVVVFVFVVVVVVVGWLRWYNDRPRMRCPRNRGLISAEKKIFSHVFNFRTAFGAHLAPFLRVPEMLFWIYPSEKPITHSIEWRR